MGRTVSDLTLKKFSFCLNMENYHQNINGYLYISFYAEIVFHFMQKKFFCFALIIHQANSRTIPDKQHQSTHSSNKGAPKNWCWSCSIKADPDPAGMEFKL